MVVFINVASLHCCIVDPIVVPSDLELCKGKSQNKIEVTYFSQFTMASRTYSRK